MKKLVWLLLAACVLAFGQVQPVASTSVKSESCGCCDCDGTCGMPDCLPAPTARVPVAAKAAPRTELTETKRRQLPAKQELAQSGRSQAPVSAALAFAPSRPLPVVNAPVFLLHCSILI